MQCSQSNPDFRSPVGSAGNESAASGLMIFCWRGFWVILGGAVSSSPKGLAVSVGEGAQFERSERNVIGIQGF